MTKEGKGGGFLLSHHFIIADSHLREAEEDSATDKVTQRYRQQVVQEERTKRAVGALQQADINVEHVGDRVLEPNRGEGEDRPPATKNASPSLFLSAFPLTVPRLSW